MEMINKFFFLKVNKKTGNIIYRAENLFLISYNRLNVSSSRKAAVSWYASVAERTKAILANPADPFLKI